MRYPDLGSSFSIMNSRAAAAVTESVIDALGRTGNTLDNLAQATGTNGSELRARIDERSELTWGEIVAAGGLSCVHPSDFMRAAA